MAENNCDTCAASDCRASKKRPDETQEEYRDRQVLESRLCRIRHKVLVLSGKGGVGKSTVAVNLAVTLAAEGLRVGLLDVDIHGPSVPRMLGIDGQRLSGADGGIEPVASGGMKVMSIGFLLQTADDAVIWRGPMKMGVIRQFVKDVSWGELDYLIVDCPPGTGDEPLSVAQIISGADGALVVTTPQEVALIDVRKSINFCRQMNLPVIGVVENMSGFVCPKCGEAVDIFQRGGGETMAAGMGVPYLGSVPVSQSIVRSGDAGQPFGLDPHNPASQAFRDIVGRFRAFIESD